MTELTLTESRLARAAWYLLITGIVCLMATVLAGAVELSITGSAAGAGNQSLFFTGDNLSAFWNGTAWHVWAVTP